MVAGVIDFRGADSGVYVVKGVYHLVLRGEDVTLWLVLLVGMVGVLLWLWWLYRVVEGLR